MIKLILILLGIALIAAAKVVQGQITRGQMVSRGNNISFYGQDCGEWVADSVKVTDWCDVDTLKKPVLTKDRNWVEDTKWRQDITLMNDAVYYPCGADPSHFEYQFRICSITGIRQKRFRIYNYHYVEPIKSDYQKIIETFKR